MKSLTPSQANDQVMSRDAVLIDVRTHAEFAAGAAEPATLLPIDSLTVEDLAAYADQPLIFICQKDPRSRRAAEMALAAGFADVAFVEGGSEAWQQSNLPWTVGDSFYDRYARHLSLNEIGETGQRRLLDSHVVMVGAGGLGAPIALYLAAAGVGHITLIDDDVVERSNLQRQVVHADRRIGVPKVESARQSMLELNPTIRVDAVQERLTSDNAMQLFADADVVIDGADNFATRHIVNDACFRLQKAWVYGAILQFDGQASVFDLRDPKGEQPCYRCLFPEAPDASFAPNCTEAGVLGVLPGLVGMIQATETLKLLLGIGDSLAGRLLQVDALKMSFRSVRLRKDPTCPQCGSHSMR